jgi:hypothetical protein
MSVESLITLVIQLVVLGVVFWLLIYIVDHVPMLGPFQQVARTIIIVVGCLIAIVLLLQFAGIMGGKLKFGLTEGGMGWRALS